LRPCTARARRCGSTSFRSQRRWRRASTATARSRLRRPRLHNQTRTPVLRARRWWHQRREKPATLASSEHGGGTQPKSRTEAAVKPAPLHRARRGGSTSLQKLVTLASSEHAGTAHSRRRGQRLHSQTCIPAQRVAAVAPGYRSQRRLASSEHGDGTQPTSRTEAAQSNLHPCTAHGGGPQHN